MPLSFAERFRTWYAHERHANAQALAMLRSVPEEARASPGFARAVGKMAHLIAARHHWLASLGEVSDRPASWFPATPLEQLPALLAAIEDRWTRYLDGLTDERIEAECTLLAESGSRWRWRLIDLLTQLHGHAWYHRGQIATLVHDLGGKPEDSDYIFWNRPTRAEDPA